MGYWKRGPRLPDEYYRDWDHKGISTEHAFWMMGHESGYSQCERDNGLDAWAEETKGITSESISPLEKLVMENDQLKALIGANYRTMREEIRKELSEEKEKEQVRGEAVQTVNPM